MPQPALFVLIGCLALLTLALAAVTVMLVRRQRRSGTDDQRLVLDQLNHLRDSVDRRLAEVGSAVQQELAENRQLVAQSSRQMLDRLASGGQAFADLSRQLGSLRESSRHLADLGEDIGKLHQILSPSTGRGQFGEHMLEELLRNVLPAGSYAMQHTLRDGVRADAVVRLAHGMVCIDAKFPLPAFERFIAASGTDDRRAARAQFARDCRRHIDVIAEKYIKPDQGTLDFAIMYVPAENVYYETIIAHADLGEKVSIADHAMGKRVVLASPNTLLAYLHVILIGLRGLEVERHASDILAALSRVSDELVRFSDDYRVVGRHLDNARAKYTDAERRLQQVATQVDQATQLGRGDQHDRDVEADPPSLRRPA